MDAIFMQKLHNSVFFRIFVGVNCFWPLAFGLWLYCQISQ